MNDSLSHADPQDRNLASEMLDGISTDTRICAGVAWSWTDHQLSWFETCESFDCDGIIAIYSNGGALKHQVLVDVPREGIEVIDQDNI